MLAELRDDNLSLVATLREAKDIADTAKDNATSAGMIDDWTDQAERRAWAPARDRAGRALNPATGPASVIALAEPPATGHVHARCAPFRIFSTG